MLPFICITASILTIILTLLGQFGVIHITLLTALAPNLIVAATLFAITAFYALQAAYRAIVIYCLQVHAVIIGEGYRYGFGQSMFIQPFDFSTPIE